MTEFGVLEETVEALAGLERRAGSAGERAAAEWLAERLRQAGARVEIDEARFRAGYPGALLPLGAAGVVGAVQALRGRWRWRSALLAGAAAALIVDDVSNGRRPWRRIAAREQTTTNVVAEVGGARDGAGERGAGAVAAVGAGERTLVVLAHHDAAPTGVVFDQSGQIALAHRFPGLIARIDTSLPLWWLVAGPPALSAVGAALASRRLTAAGGALGVATLGLGLDIARSPVVPGANDNLSACAALVALAEELRARPVEGLRVLLVSCGAEEILQGGVYDFVRDRLGDADRARTSVVVLDTIGSPELIMVEGEGPFRMEDYTDPSLRDRLAALAAAKGEPVRRGLRSRASTDGVVTSRAGFPTAVFASWDPATKVLTNYHLMTDTPDRLSYATIARAVRLVAALARDLAP